jgi:hypothetical protein
MGKSLQDALDAALAGGDEKNFKEKARRAKSEKHNKLPVEDDKNIFTEGKREILEKDVTSFSNYMQKKGVPPAKFRNTRNIDSRPLQKKSPHRTDKKQHFGKKNTEVRAKSAAVIKKQVPRVQPTRKATPVQSQQRPSSVRAAGLPEQGITNTPPPVPPQPYTIKIKPEITLSPVLTALHKVANPFVPVHEGITEQVEQITSPDDEREVVIGLDFGTAVVKVVVGDAALNKAFAVPFSQDIGLPAYLLPSQVWLDADSYTLVERGTPKSNLKLRLIDPDPATGMEDFSHSAAFLALVIRQARGWLLSERADVYRRVKILWKLALGLPAATYENQEMVERFKKLAAAAWFIAGFPDKIIKKHTVAKVCNEVSQMTLTSFCEEKQISNTEFDVVPELSAQIYGFLNSTRFDPLARNLFLMVDVGAGTVDSTVFHVTRGRGNKFQFRFLSNIVDFHGVFNLHQARLRCFKSALENNSSPQSEYLKLTLSNLPTVNLLGIPERMDDYFKGVEVIFSNTNLNPDVYFYKKIRNQVVARTVGDSRDYLLNVYELGEMPMFLCGGGSRMQFYRKLEKDLLAHPNATWFGFRPQRLEVPSNLSSSGIKPEDFDRLSVAFGLSFLNVGEYLRGELQPYAGIPSTVTPRRCQWCKSLGICYCS